MKKIVYSILTTLFKREWLLKLLVNKQEKTLLEFTHRGYLYDIGWTNSISTGSVVNKNGDPLPWVTYPYIQFIGPRLNKQMQLFEFGSGNSTLYYAPKVASVTSVEHDSGWYEEIRTKMPANVRLSLCELQPGGEYCQYAAQQQTQYDVVIVDGRDRVNCCLNSIGALKGDGILVLDDSEREKYAGAHQFMKQKGFKQIDFWGTAPIVDYLKCTTIFYRDGNCLGI
jgi:hypothetical protein